MGTPLERVPRADAREVLVTSALRESVYGVAAATDRRLVLGGPSARPAAIFAPSQPELGEGTRAVGPVATWHEARWQWDSLRPDDVAWALSFALGPGTTTAADGTAWRHVIAPDDGWSLPSFTAEEVVAPTWHDRYPGGIVRRLGIVGGSAPGSGITIAANLLFRGWDMGTGTGIMVTAEPIWRFAASRLWIGTAYAGTYDLGQSDLAGTSELTAWWLGFAASIDNDVELEHLFDFAGGAAVRAERGERKLSLRATFEFADRDLLDDLATGAARAIEIDWASGVRAGETTQAYGAELIWPRAVLAEATTRDGEDGRLVADLVWRVLADPTHGSFVAAVWNRTAAYAGEES